MRRTAALSAVFAIVLSGCGSSARPLSASQRPTPTPSATVVRRLPPITTIPSTTAPSATPSRFRQPYANAFEDFFAAYTRADEAGNPSSPDLVRYSTSIGLAWARKQVSDHVKLGVAHRGYWQFRDLGAVDVTASSARVGQCMDWSNWPVVNRTTGVTFQQFTPWSQLVDADVALQGGQWKVTSIQVQAGAC